MSLRATLRCIAREWFVALCAYSLLIAPFGCQLQRSLFDDDGIAGELSTSSAGLFINDDLSSPLLIAGRNNAGDAFFVYGTRDADGNLAEIESILVRTADGEESFVTFESGRPVHAQAPDGSYVHIAYQEVSQSRLTATTELYTAQTEAKESYTVDIDLAQTAEQIARLVEEATGQELKTTTLTSRSLDKDDLRSLRITIFSPLFALFVVPLVAAVTVMTVILGQVLVLVYQTVVVAIQTVLLAVFSPLFLVASLLSETIVRIEFVPFSDLFITIPPPPIVILF
jgi:hypothetical protein